MRKLNVDSNSSARAVPVTRGIRALFHPAERCRANLFDVGERLFVPGFSDMHGRAALSTVCKHCHAILDEEIAATHGVRRDNLEYRNAIVQLRQGF